MSKLLCISVTFPDRLFHGRADGEEPEWPPSPHRLFQALVAGSLTGGRARDWSDAKAEAFRWLERKDPPLIIAPEAERATGYTLFVPNNDGDRKPQRQDRLTGKRARPHFLRNGAAVHYLWPLEEQEWSSSRDLAELTAKEARHLFTLGWGVDAAFADGRIVAEDEVGKMEGIRWRASSGYSSSGTHRVPKATSLDDLEEVHRSFLQSVEGNLYRPRKKPTAFDRAAYVRETTVPHRPCALFEFQEEVAFRQEEVAIVAAMLRSRACEAAKNDTHEFPGGSEIYVAGHAKGRRSSPERFSYLPLPSIGHPHSDGMIRRVLVAEPYGGDGGHAEWAKLRLRNLALTDEKDRERTLLLEPWRGSGVWDHYLGISTTWSTVTPVILPGHDDRDPKRKAPALFLKALEQAGIPSAAIADFQLRKAPSWHGSQHPRQYRRPAYLNHLPAWHVIIRFNEPIPGPLAIGAGRYCGLGVFAARVGSRLV